MITVHMIGGLGNQLFQYAAAQALAHRLGTQVRLNLEEFARAEPGLDPGLLFRRPFELDKFAIAPIKIADREAERYMRRLRWLPAAFLGGYASP
jgi:hypothetical protein